MRRRGNGRAPRSLALQAAALVAQHGERGADARGLRAGAAGAARQVDELALARHPERLQRVARAPALGQLPLDARGRRLQRACKGQNRLPFPH